jgi:hypothetical protein
LAFPWTNKPWFLTEGKFASVLIIPSSWGSQLGDYQANFLAPLPGTVEEEAPTLTTFSHVNYAPAANFLALLPGKNKTSARGVSYAHPLLCFKFCFYFIFTCIILSKTQKKISFLYSCI